MPPPHDLQKFFSILLNRERQGSMQILHLVSHPSQEHLPVASVSIPINIDTIRPLLRFSNMRKIYLLMVNLDFSDEHLTAMATAWPYLEVFDFNNGDSWATPYNITLRGLFSLVNMCPHLKSAHLAINANVLEGTEDCPASMIGAKNLQHLVLGDTVVENPRAVALVVYLALPKVEKIVASNTWSHVAPTNDPPWAKLNEYLEAFRLLQGGRWKA